MLEMRPRRYAGDGGYVRVLLIDTCGEIGSVALGEGNGVVASRELPARTASSALLQAIRDLLSDAGWQKDDIDAVGVVSGPGSFTGVRVGLTAAKGFCEARNVPLAAVSRLLVLEHVSELKSGYVVMNAGRGDLYVREIGAEHERLFRVEDFLQIAGDSQVAIDEQKLASMLMHTHLNVHPLSADAALPLVLRRLSEGGDDVASIDANYGRTEQQIYGKQTLGISGVSLA